MKISKKNQHLLYGFLFFFCIVRYFMITSLPIYVRDVEGADEYLMLYQAEQLLQGNYLGPYDQLTLVKGPFFPVFLACCNWLGIPYLSGIALLYILGCVIAMKAVRRIVSNDIINLILFVVLLFIPTVSSSYVQLVYRDAITPALILNMMGALMLSYLNRQHWKPFLLWLLYALFFWIALWFTREDSIWTVPLIGVFVTVMVVQLVLEKNHTQRSERLLKSAICFMPVVLLFGSIQLLSAINYHYYGIFSTNELNDSRYTDAVMLLTKIEPDEEQDYVTISHSAIRKAYEASPTFAELKPIIEHDYEVSPLLAAGRNPDNGEFNEDLITWELRGAACSMGHYSSGQASEAFWGAVAQELQQAMDDGTLKTRPILPSRSMIPWPGKEGSVKNLLKAIGTIYQCIYSYDYTHLYCLPASAAVGPVIDRYEGLTGNATIAPSMWALSLDGCFFLKDNADTICSINLVDSNHKLLATAEPEQSEDVYNYYLSNFGADYPNARKARFSFRLEMMGSELDTLATAEFLNENGDLIYGCNISQLIAEPTTDDYCFELDAYNIQVVSNDSYFQNKIQRAETVLKYYRLFNPTLSISAMAIYLIWTLLIIVRMLQKKKVIIDAWLCASACAGSSLVYLLGLAYVHAFMVDTVHYTAGLTVLHQLFVVVVDGYALSYLLSHWKTKLKRMT